MDKILLVAKREYLAYVTAWGFWLGMIFTPFILLLAVGLPTVIERSQPARYYTVVDQEGRFTDALKRELGVSLAVAPDVPPGMAPPLTGPTDDFAFVAPPAETIEDLRPYLLGERAVSGPLGGRELFAAFIVSEDGIEYWSADVVVEDLYWDGQRAIKSLARADAFDRLGVDPQSISDAVNAVPDIKMLSPSVSDASGEISIQDRAPFFVSFGLSFMLWLLIFSVVNYLLTGTVEERSNKIFDTLLTSVSLPQLMTGKLFGVLCLSLTLISVWGIVGGTLFLAGGSSIPDDVFLVLGEILNPRLIIPTLLSFILGYLMYGAMFLALGSLCDSIQEAQALLSPMFIVMMVPLVMIPVAISSPDSPMLNTLSWVPLLTPFLLILRIPNDMSLMLIIAQLIWMGAFTMLTIWAGTRIYRAGAVHGTGLTEIRDWALRRFKRKKA